MSHFSGAEEHDAFYVLLPALLLILELSSIEGTSPLPAHAIARSFCKISPELPNSWLLVTFFDSVNMARSRFKRRICLSTPHLDSSNISPLAEDVIPFHCRDSLVCATQLVANRLNGTRIDTSQQRNVGRALRLVVNG